MDGNFLLILRGACDTNTYLVNLVVPNHIVLLIYLPLVFSDSPFSSNSGMMIMSINEFILINNYETKEWLIIPVS
jgi:hypothetical protein